MDSIDFTPDGDIDIGTFTDDAGVSYCCIAMTDPGRDASLQLFLRFDHFVAFADHLRSVADTLLDKRR